MKKLFLLLTFLCIASCLFAQVLKTVNVAAAGTLYPSISFNELKTITNLTVTGKIDARDFRLMREKMTSLTVLDFSGVTIVHYADYLDNSIPDSAFYSCSKLTSVIIPSSVTNIGIRAFMWCWELPLFKIPSSVTSIGESAFYGCYKLTSITIPSSVTSIKDDTFMACHELASVTIPSSVTSIGNSAFGSCDKLTSVTIPSSVTTIGKSAFMSCSKLTSIAIPSSVTSIEGFTFKNCSALTSVTISSSVTSIGEYAFTDCSKLTSITIPSSATSIGNYAFNGCSELTSVTINSLVTYLGVDAFEYCPKLTSLTMSSVKPPVFSSNISFYDIFAGYLATSCILYVPFGSGMAYSTANVWKSFQSIVEKNITGINPIICDQELTIFPNPTTDFIILNFKQFLDKTALLTIFDISGKAIITREISSQRTQIDFRAIPSGTYFCQIFIDEQKLEAVKLIKK